MLNRVKEMKKHIITEEEYQAAKAAARRNQNKHIDRLASVIYSLTHEDVKSISHRDWILSCD